MTLAATMPRWLAAVTYRTEAGPVMVEHDLVELHEIHDLVERGPNWDCISAIEIQRVDPTERDLTVERASTL